MTFSVNGNRLIKEDATDFGPWGERLTETGQLNTTENRHLYQNKESLTLFGLEDLNDFGDRYVDRTLGRMWGVDNLAEKFSKHSPYNYTLNNPLNMLDPDGNSSMRIGGYWNERGYDSEAAFSHYSMGESIVGNGGGDDKDKKKQQKQPLPIGDIGTGLGTVGEGLWMFGQHQRSIDLYQQGFRRGIEGNYQLTGRNFSLFGNQTMTETTKPITELGKAGRYASNVGTGLGVIGGVVDIYSFATRKSPEEFSGYKLTYNLTGLGSSLFVGAKVGSGWGALVGLAFYGGQVGLDASKKVGNEIKTSYNNFKKSLTHSWLLTK